jgi:tetratricopeptide (TPR) repeat protein
MVRVDLFAQINRIGILISERILEMRKLLVVLALMFVWLFCVASSPVVTGAKVRIKAKKYEDAVKVLEESKAQYPNDPELFYYLARAYAGQAQWEMAGKNFTEALTKSPEPGLKKEIEKWRDFNWSSFIKEAAAILQQKRYREAIDKYRLANLINPDRKEGFANIAVAQLELGKTFDESQPAQPDSAKAYYNLAIDNFKRAVELDPGNEQFVKNLGQAYTISGKDDEAIALYEKILENNPDDSQSKGRLVTLYMTRQEFENAARIYDSMLQDAGAELTGPDYFNAGGCYYQLYIVLNKKEDEASKKQAVENLKKAADAYTKVIELDPTDCESSTQLYYSCIALNEWNKVIKTIEGMLANGCPRDYATLANLGVAYMKIDDKKKSVEILMEAEKLKPTSENK